MSITYLTRHDTNCGDGIFDSIAWAFEVHVKKPDTGVYNFAALYGNEDAPDYICFWKSESPIHEGMPDYTWHIGDSYKVTWNPVVKLHAIAYIELLNCYVLAKLELEDVEAWAESEELTYIETEIYEWFTGQAFDILVDKLDPEMKERLKASVTERLTERKLKTGLKDG